MNITMQKQDAVNARITVSVEENDYKEKVVKELKTIGKRHQIPGFRKGHVTITELQRRFGRDVTSDVINREVYEGVMKYIDDNKLNVLGQPVPVEVKELDLKNNKDFTFEYDLALAPELDVKVDKSEHIPYYKIEVTDEMVAEQDKAFRKRFGAQVPGETVEPDALVKGSLIELNEDGTPKEGDDAIAVANGILGPMFFKSKEEAELFAGKKVGDKVVFNPWKSCEGDPAELSSMLQVDKARVADLHNNFEMTISEIIVVRPAEYNEEFYTQVFGKDKVHNEEEYREAIRQMISNELSNNSNSVFRLSARNFFTEKYGEMDLPAATLKKWLVNYREGINAENVDEEYDKMVPDLKWQLIKEAIAGKLNVNIEDQDVLNFAKIIAAQQFAQYGMTNMDDETITNYAKNLINDKNYRTRIVEQAYDNKLFSEIRNAVTLDEEEVSIEKFREIVTTL